jgi:ABC-type branched-subunit amino acid transport system ATPase component
VALLEVDDVWKSFGGVRALQGVSLRLDPAHRLVGLMGPNGSGKTTLFNVVTGVYRPDRGAVRLNGRNLVGLAPWDIANIGLGRTFQIPRVFAELTVEENLLVGITRLSRDLRRRAEELLELFELAQVSGLQAHRLSVGQQKLVELARVLLRPRAFILADEVTAGLHFDLVARIGNYLRLLARSGTCFLLVEHNVGFLMELCTYIYVMENGRIISHGQPKEVRSDERVIAAYLGAPT